MRTEPWLRNLEQKFLADEREVYKGTPSEETKIEKTIKIEENRRFSTSFPSKMLFLCRGIVFFTIPLFFIRLGNVHQRVLTICSVFCSKTALDRVLFFKRSHFGKVLVFKRFRNAKLLFFKRFRDAKLLFVKRFHYVIAKLTAGSSAGSAGYDELFLLKGAYIKRSFKLICSILKTYVREKHNASSEH